MGTPSVDTTTDVKVDTDTVILGIVNLLLLEQLHLLLLQIKTKKRQQQLQKNPKLTKLELCVKALHSLVLVMMVSGSTI